MESEQTPLRAHSTYREGKHRLRSIRRMLFWITAMQAAVSVIMAIIVSFFPSSPPLWLQILPIELFAYLLPLSLYARENRLLTTSDARERFGLRACPKRLLPAILALGIGGQCIMILLNLPVNLLLAEGDTAIPTTLTDLLASLIVVGAIPALFEEFLFRGIVYGVMKEFNDRAALLFTTLLFALMHGSLTGFFGFLFLGWATVFVLRRSGSLYAAMLLHLSNNVTALLLSHFSTALLDFPTSTLWLFLGGILLAVAGFLMLYTRTEAPPKVRLIKTADLLGQSLLSPPILLCIGCIIGLWILR